MLDETPLNLSTGKSSKTNSLSTPALAVMCFPFSHLVVILFPGWSAGALLLRALCVFQLTYWLSCH